MNKNKRIRVIMAKPGLDGHDRGIKILARAFRDSGMEVIYLGLRQTPQMIVNAAIQEDADVIALSVLSGAHMTIFTKIKELLDKNHIQHILITGGGIIPKEDMVELNKVGIGQLFGPGTPVQDTIDYITNWMQAHNNVK
ncbi:MAG: methylmalonyl-CoA mutase [Candidatus Marinimicrobia bacterium]|nr:methylmalonyl-CoA mutase [Candidatus Neomarinimicrobiota bacterium]|tara:strand:+ start:30781 stop:31197 length:417 start_codon:yes stop_codon:yes gene_type:complete